MFAQRSLQELLGDHLDSKARLRPVYDAPADRIRDQIRDLKPDKPCRFSFELHVWLN